MALESEVLREGGGGEVENCAAYSVDRIHDDDDVDTKKRVAFLSLVHFIAQAVFFV